MCDYLLKRPMLLTALCCCAVSVFSFYSKLSLIYIMLSLSVLIGILIYIQADKRLIFISALIFAMCLSCNATSDKIERLSYYGNNGFKAELTVISNDYKSDEYYISTAEVMKSETLPKGTRLTVFYEPMKLSEGVRISADIRVKKIDDVYSKKISYSEGIYLKGNLKNISILSNREDFVLTAAFKIKEYIKTQLFGNLGYGEASTLCALIFGNRDYFTNEFYGCVKVAGVSHVMVVSGMHLSIIVTLLIRLLEKLFYNRFVKAFVIIFTVIFLCVICGFTKSILRAGITYIIMAIGIMLDRKGVSENSLGAAITIILIYSPYAIFSVALQLSALSTFGILAVALPIIDYIKNKGIIQSNTVLYILSSLLISLSATLLTLPVLIKIFGYVSTVSVLSNLLISPAVTISLYTSIAALVIGGIFPFLNNVLYLPTGIITKYINCVIKFFGKLTFATANVPEYLSYIAAFLIFLVLWGLLACKKRRNMLRLEGMRNKIIKEGGKRLKWQ